MSDSDSKYRNVILFFGGQVKDPNNYSTDLQGFDSYLKETGVKYTTAEELTRPRHKTIAKELGYDNFLPPKEWWPRTAALAMMFTKLREHVGKPIYIYNAWRPEAYNSHPDIGGAKSSDHITNNAIDCDFNSQASRHKAEQWLRQHYNNPLLNMSLGLGAEKIHIGLLSPSGKRYWYYSSYPINLRRSFRS